MDERENKTEGIPLAFQAKLFDMTGDDSGGCKGFLLFYVNRHGDVATIQKTASSVIALGFQKALEIRAEQGKGAVMGELEEGD